MIDVMIATNPGECVWIHHPVISTDIEAWWSLCVCVMLGSSCLDGNEGGR